MFDELIWIRKVFSQQSVPSNSSQISDKKEPNHFKLHNWNNMKVHSVFPQSTIMQKLLQLSALKATKNLFVFFFYKMQLCNFWPDSELLIAWLRWNGWVTNWLCRKQILSKKCRSIAFKIGTTIDIDTFLAKRSRTDLILGQLLI